MTGLDRLMASYNEYKGKGFTDADAIDRARFECEFIHGDSFLRIARQLFSKG